MMLKKPNVIHPVYNAGRVGLYSVTQQKDKYGTPIRGKYDYKQVMRPWFRKLGITADDIYYANADSARLDRKVAIARDVDIDTTWIARIENKEYEIYRRFYSWKNDETELSLIEVGYADN